MLKDTVVIVDPFSTGALIAPELKNKGIKCYAVLSEKDIPQRFLQSYTGAGFYDKKLYSIDTISTEVSSGNVLAIISGSETGVYCAEKLASFYDVKKNDYKTSDYRRKKSEMQAQLAACGLKNISSKKINKENNNIDNLDSETGFVIKPDNSCLTDGVMFFDDKKSTVEWINNIDWNMNNIMGVPNEYYLVQEKINGEEYVVDLVVDKDTIKVCTLCRYKKGLYNGSHFVYKSLEVLDINDLHYKDIIEYAKKVAVKLGVEFGPAHLEIMNTLQGPVLIELGARLHGGIAPTVFEKCYSPGLLTSFIDMIVDKIDTNHSLLMNKARIVFLINEDNEFTITNVSSLKDKMMSVKYVDQVKFFIEENQKVPLTTDLSNCPGIVSIVANSEEELDSSEKKIREIFNS